MEDVPAAVAEYLDELAARLEEVLGDALLGAYAGGSLALRGFDPASSDIDVIAVMRGRLEPKRRRALVQRIRSDAIPVPARGLEFVLYAGDRLADDMRRPAIELELNDGPGMPFRSHSGIDERLGGDGAFWYGLDLSIVRQSGIVLRGPRPDEVIPAVPRDVLADLLRESVDWHLAQASEESNGTLNPVRALAFARTGRWIAKPEAAQLPEADLPLQQLVRLTVQEVDRQLGRRGQPVPDSSARSGSSS